MTAKNTELQRSTHASSSGQLLGQIYLPGTDEWKEVTGRDLGGGDYGPNIVAWGKTAGGVYVPLTVDASGNLQVAVTGSNASAYEQLAVSNVVKTLTAAVYAAATRAVITVEDAEIRFTLDGTNPTTTLGHLVYVSDEIVLTSAADIASFKAIRTGSTDAEINVTYSS